MTKPNLYTLVDVDLMHNHSDIDWRGLRLMKMATLKLAFDNTLTLNCEVRDISPPAIRPGEFGTAKLLVLDTIDVPPVGSQFTVEMMGYTVISGCIAQIGSCRDIALEIPEIESQEPSTQTIKDE